MRGFDCINTFGNTVWPSLCCRSQSDISCHLLLKLIASAHGWIRNTGRSRWQLEPVGSRKQPHWWGLAMWLASYGRPEFVAFTSAVWGCWNMCADVQGLSLKSMESALHTPLTILPRTYGLSVSADSPLTLHFWNCCLAHKGKFFWLLWCTRASV